MSKFVCPYCYETHSLNDCGMKCSYNIAGNTDVMCQKKVQKDADGWIPNNKKAGCMNCQMARKSIFCPVTQEEVPRDFLQEEGLPIALIGAKAVGKSNYIGVLINEIKKRMSLPFHCMLSLCSNQRSLDYYNEYYYNPLFEKQVVLPGTDAGEIPPMIFPLRFTMGRREKTAILTFYDTAGENLDTDEDMLVFNRYIPNAKGIILLLDPLQVPSVRAKLEGKMQLPAKNTDAVTVLQRVIENIRQVKNVKGKINIPLAIAFTKMDALEKFDILPPDSPLRQESEHLARGAFVLSDFQNCNIEMQDILENFLDDELLQLMEQFTKHSLFGLSAFGAVPVNNKLSGGGIHPKRVLDPLLWLLAENKYIQTVK